LGRSLLLNATFEPLCLVSARRAVVLVLKEKAEILERNGAEMRSERATFVVPSVIRLTHYVRVPHRTMVPLSRRAVFARDDSRCQYCGRAAENIDHVVPRSRGGDHAWDNVVAACRPCNARKEDRLLSECGMQLRRPPEVPHASMWVVAAASGRIDPAWHAYLGLDALAV
jgi:5-methylcytosine-specific restriction endonuclease McrA